MLDSPLLSLFSDTLRCRAGGSDLFPRNDDDGEKMSPSLCFLLAPLEMFSWSLSKLFLLFTGWVVVAGTVLVGSVVFDEPRTGRFLGIDFFKRKLCFGFVHPSGCSSSMIIKYRMLQLHKVYFIIVGLMLWKTRFMSRELYFVYNWRVPVENISNWEERTMPQRTHYLWLLPCLVLCGVTPSTTSSSQ